MSHYLDADLLQRLPLPVAQQLRSADNARNVLDRHWAAFYIWETSLKLLGAVAIVELAERGTTVAPFQEQLESLSRPSLGHWCGYVRELVKELAHQDPGFEKIQGLLTGKSRENLPRCAGLAMALNSALEGKTPGKSVGKLQELFDRLVSYRNSELGHGVVGARGAEHYIQMGESLLAAGQEFLGKVDLLAGRRLVYVSDVRRQTSGNWLIQQYELRGESASRLVSVELPESEMSRLPRPERVYLASREVVDDLLPELVSLHPLLLFDLECGHVFFLNAQNSKLRADYLCYRTGETIRRPELGQDQREMLASVLGKSVDREAVQTWASRCFAEEPSYGEAPEALAPLRKIGEFELLSEIGRGGMGVVYRAWQPSLNREVALKCLLKSGDSKTDARFQREIKALGKVDHPGLVRIFTSGSAGDQWYYAMELVEGADLARVCEQLTASSSAGEINPDAWQRAVSSAWQAARSAEKPVAPEERPSAKPLSPSAVAAATPKSGVSGRSYVNQVVTLVRQVATAVQALHEKGVIHRDIKPGNIMLTTDGQQAVLMDLGLAQLVDDVEGRLTRTRQFVGTLRYASPEQERAVGELDGRTDIYSLGATLWELLTLKPLYGASDEMPTAEVIAAIQRTDPVSPREHNPHVPLDLAAVVSKCLEKDRAKRYATASELVDELQRVLNREPVQARPIGQGEKFRRWCRRNPAIAGSGLAIALTLIIATGVSTAFGLYALQQASIAKQNEDLANERGIETAKQLTNLRSAAFSAQMKRASLLAASQPAEALAILYDQRLCPSEFRDFTWGHLNRVCHRHCATLNGHSEGVYSVLFSPDGRTLASGSGDGTIKLWDVARGLEQATLKGHSASVTSVSFSPDGRTLASGSGDGTVKLWDVASGQEQATLKGHSDRVASVSFSPDGRTLASGDGDGTIKLWDVASDLERATLIVHGGVISSVSFSPDGRTLASASFNWEIKLWHVASGQEQATLKGHITPVHSVSFSPDGRTLASGSSDGTIKLWNVASGQEQATLKGHSGTVPSVSFSPDGQTLASGSGDGTIKLWEVASGLERATLIGHGDVISSVSFSPDGQTLASGADCYDEPSEIMLWDVASGQERATLNGHSDSVFFVSFSPDGQTLASGSSDGTIKLWDVASGQERATLNGHSGTVHSVSFSPNGQTLASGSGDGTIKLWEVASGLERATLTGHGDVISSVSFSPDGRTLASGSGRFLENSEIMLWDVSSGQERATLNGHSGGVHSVSFSPDGRTLASGSGRFLEPSEIKLWDVASGQERTTLKRHSDRVTSVSFSPDGRTLSSGSGDGTITLWDIASGLEKATLEGHNDSVRSVMFSPDGQALASASSDGTIKLWDAASGLERVTLEGHNDSVLSVMFSPDGQALASASNDSTIKLWDAASGLERATLGGHRNFVHSLSFSPDGRTLASGSGSYFKFGEIKLWNVASGLERATMDGHLGCINSVSFSPDGQTLASGRDNFVEPGEIKLWNVVSRQELVKLVGLSNTVHSVPASSVGRINASGSGDSESKLRDEANGQESYTPPGFSNAVNSVSFSPDGRTLASGSSDRTIKLWDVASGLERATLEGHRNFVHSVSFSPDGQTLASGSSDGTIKLWDVASGQERATLNGHSDSVFSVSFSPDGRTIASGSMDGTIKLWDVDKVAKEGAARSAARLITHGASLVACEWTGDWFGACAHLHYLIHGFPEDIDFRQRRGWAYAEVGWWWEAIPDYRQAVAMTPDNLGPRNKLAWALLASGDTSHLEASWAETTSKFRHSSDAATLSALAHTRLLWPLTHPEERRQVLSWAASGVNGKPETHAALEILGAAQFRAGDPQTAITTLERAAEREAATQESPSLWTELHLALAYAASGDLPAAQNIGDRIPANEPTDADWTDRLIWRTLYPELRQRLYGATAAPASALATENSQ